MTLILNSYSELERMKFRVTLYNGEKVVFSSDPLGKLIRVLSGKKAEMKILTIQYKDRYQIKFDIKFFYPLVITEGKIDCFLDGKLIHTKGFKFNPMVLEKGYSLQIFFDLKVS